MIEKIRIRPATADDAFAIRAIVRASLLNPLGLAWPRFLVAEQDGGLIAIGQVKPHRGGTRELASIAVVPEWQGLGVGGAIVRALLSRESGPVYLMCASPTARFYQRFGFAVLEPPAMPAYFRRFARAAGLLSRLSGGRAGQLAIMRRNAE